MVEFISRLADDGRLSLPESVQASLGLQPGGWVVVEMTPAGLLLRAAKRDSKEWTNERLAETLLNGSCDEGEYQRNRSEVRAMGLDPDAIRHQWQH